jgi:EmrB/QacA subfamily drug resistance transporter
MTAPPAGSRPPITTILIALMTGMFLAALDQTVMATAIRTIADDLHGFELQAWATTAFLITSTISTPLYGKLSDLHGRRRYFLFAIGVFIIGSVLCGMARDMYQLAGFRAVQGIGAGGLLSLAFSIIGDVVPPRERARYQGYTLAVFGSASVVGPVLGGFLAGSDEILGVAGWRWVFLLNVPIGIVAMLIAARTLPRQYLRVEHRVDWPGALALIVALVPLLTIAEEGTDWGWSSQRALICYGVGGVGLVAFLVVEAVYRAEALLPFRLFANRTVAVGSLSNVVLGFTMFGGLMTIPLYLQIVKGASPTRAGLEMIPVLVGLVISTLTAGRLISRTGRYRIFPVIGSLLMVAALALLTRIGADTPLWQLMGMMVVMGLGLGGVMDPTTFAVQNAVPPQQMGVATGAVTFFRSMGGTIGTTVLLTVLFNVLPDKISSAYATAQSEPEFRRAVAADPGQLDLVRQARGGSALDDTSFLDRLAGVVAHPFKLGFADSLHSVFLVALGVTVAGVLVSVLLPNVPLAERSAQDRLLDGDAPAGPATARPRTAGDPAAVMRPAGTLFAVSDLHVSFPENWRAVQQLEPESGADWLVVAGGIGRTFADIEKTLRLLRERYARVIWTPGNQELWSHPGDPVRLSGPGRYASLIEMCQDLGVLTPEDDYPVWPTADGPVTIAPVFQLYDFTWRAPGATSRYESLDYAYTTGVVSSDELLLRPEPYADRESWCADRLAETERRLGSIPPSMPTVLVSHWPLLRRATAAMTAPELAQWCGTEGTADWHTRFRAVVAIHGHVRDPGTSYHDGVRFEEVSLGYPRDWKGRDDRPRLPRRIF